MKAVIVMVELELNDEEILEHVKDMPKREQAEFVLRCFWRDVSQRVPLYPEWLPEATVSFSSGKLGDNNCDLHEYFDMTETLEMIEEGKKGFSDILKEAMGKLMDSKQERENPEQEM